MNNQISTEPLLVACSNKSYIAKHLPSLLQYFDVNTVGTDSALRAGLEFNQKQVVIMDSVLFDFRGSNVLAVLNDKYPQSKFVVLTSSQDQAFLMKLLKSGARGYLHHNLEPDSIVKALTIITQGGMWAERHIMEHLLTDLGQEFRKVVKEAEYLSRPRLTSLTVRENEIAHLIALGSNDKKLAKELNISTNTVKNHLQNIYIKLGVSDRLQLALMVNGIKV